MASSHSRARKLISRGTTERGEHRELGSGLTGALAAAWRPGDGGEMTEERNSATMVLRLRKRGE
jgi:hypothetical protein